MIEMKVMGIALDVRTNSPIVVLHDLDNRKALPIWIGSAEASAIIRCIEGLVVARPMTHDLITNIIEPDINLIKLKLMMLKKKHITQLCFCQRMAKLLKSTLGHLML